MNETKKLTSKIKSKLEEMSKILDLKDLRNFSKAILNRLLEDIKSIEELSSQIDLVSDVTENVTNNIINSINTKLNSQSIQNKQSFAQVTATTNNNHNHNNNSINSSSHSYSIIIKPKDPVTTPANTIEPLLLQKFNPAKEKITVDNIKKINNGIILKTNDKQTADNLENKLKQINELNTKLNIYQPKSLNPTISISNISNYIPNNELISQILDSNEELVAHKNDLRLLFTQQHTFTKNAVFRVTPAIIGILRKMNMKIPIGYSICNIQLKFFVRQCQNCFKFDHSTKHCSTIHTSHTCSKCAIQYNSSTAHTCSNNICCFNCKFSKNSDFNKNTNHLVNTTNCPLYNKQLKLLIDKTDTNGYYN